MHHQTNVCVIIMGVSGVGKTTIGKLFAIKKGHGAFYCQ